jgi:hypothetical protein
VPAIPLIVPIVVVFGLVLAAMAWLGAAADQITASLFDTRTRPVLPPGVQEPDLPPFVFRSPSPVAG